MTAGAEADKVLTTDASGVASWQTAAGGSGMVTNFVFTNSTGITGTVATPTITPTLSLALTSAAVGLGNVTNESKTTMFASPTFTGTVSGITKAMVGLGSADNTADTAKPVSTAQQTALNLKANLASPTFTGTVTVPTPAVAGAAATKGYVDVADGYAFCYSYDSYNEPAGCTCPAGFTLYANAGYASCGGEPGLNSGACVCYKASCYAFCYTYSSYYDTCACPAGFTLFANPTYANCGGQASLYSGACVCYK